MIYSHAVGQHKLDSVDKLRKEKKKRINLKVGLEGKEVKWSVITVYNICEYVQNAQYEIFK